MTQSLVIRFPLRLCKADKQALRRLELLDSEIAGPEAQVRTAPVLDLAASPKFQARRAANGHDPHPPAGGAALRWTA